ncbi:hypothetical protein [Fredinandcohnia sp. 179-A 10B2 NHS]
MQDVGEGIVRFERPSGDAFISSCFIQRIILEGPGNGSSEG